MFFKIGVLKYFAIFTGKHLCWKFFFKVASRKVGSSSKMQFALFILKTFKNFFEKLSIFSKNLEMSQIAGGRRGHAPCAIMTHAYENLYVSHP